MLSRAALLPFLLSACAVTQTPDPSLAPRAAESVDPRVPIPGEAIVGEADPAVVARLGALITQAEAGDAAFGNAALLAEQLAAAAGQPQSESWIAAHEALSAAQAARAPTTRAMADIDALAAGLIAGQAGISSGNLAAVEEAIGRVGRMDQAQAERINAIQARLGG